MLRDRHKHELTARHEYGQNNVFINQIHAPQVDVRQPPSHENSNTNLIFGPVLDAKLSNNVIIIIIKPQQFNQSLLINLENYSKLHSFKVPVLLKAPV